MERIEGLDRPTLSVAESLALIEQQRDRVGRHLDPDPVVLYATWGAAWAVGFAAFYLVGSELLDVPFWTVGLLFTALIVGAVVVTAVYVARAGRGVRGESSTVGAMYGCAWMLGFGCMAAVNIGLSRLGLTGEQVAALWPAGSLLVVGLMYLAGGALWRDRFQYGLGVWMLATDAVSVFFGVPGNYLVLTVAGGGGFLAAAGWFALRRGASRRSRRSSSS